MPTIPKRYFYDRVVLVLLTVSIFIALALVINILIRVTSGQGAVDYFVQYRSTAGVRAFSPGGVGEILTFILFGVITLITSITLSIRTYATKKELSLAILSFGILLLLLAVIVSNALLALR
jgi:1,4-dihydroxy-2-naphthoate octaprenyltransferase